MSQQTEHHAEEGITFFGNQPSDVLAAFHASGLSAKGFAISGRIVRQTAQLIGSAGEKDRLFDGEARYAATFMRTRPTS